MDRIERHNYVMAKIKEILDKPKPVDPKLKEKQERLAKMRAEAYEKRKGSIFDVMPDSMQKEQMENEAKYGFKIRPPEDL